MDKKLIILGSGGYGRTVYDIGEQLDYSITVLDDSDQEHLLDFFSRYIKDETKFISAFGIMSFVYRGLRKLKRLAENLSL